MWLRNDYRCFFACLLLGYCTASYAEKPPATIDFRNGHFTDSNICFVNQGKCLYRYDPDKSVNPWPIKNGRYQFQNADYFNTNGSCFLVLEYQNSDGYAYLITDKSYKIIPTWHNSTIAQLCMGSNSNCPFSKSNSECPSP